MFKYCFCGEAVKTLKPQIKDKQTSVWFPLLTHPVDYLSVTGKRNQAMLKCIFCVFVSWICLCDWTSVHSAGAALTLVCTEDTLTEEVNMIS